MICGNDPPVERIFARVAPVSIALRPARLTFPLGGLRPNAAGERQATRRHTVEAVEHSRAGGGRPLPRRGSGWRRDDRARARHRRCAERADEPLLHRDGSAIRRIVLSFGPPDQAGAEGAPFPQRGARLRTVGFHRSSRTGSVRCAVARALTGCPTNLSTSTGGRGSYSSLGCAAARFSRTTSRPRRAEAGRS